jgi:hypothetical protein
MNRQDYLRRIRAATVATAVAGILAACATTPAAPPGSVALRSKLTVLKSETNLATQIPVALEQAEGAVVLAEKSQGDAELAAHRVFIADRMIDTARATAETRLAEAQRPALKQQIDNERLAARTREADTANRAAVTARADAPLPAVRPTRRALTQTLHAPRPMRHAAQRMLRPQQRHCRKPGKRNSHGKSPCCRPRRRNAASC